jgi:hypothetical protein
MTTKEALSQAMANAAGYTNVVRKLAAIAKEIPAETFIRLAEQHPDTVNRDLQSAEQNFQRAKEAYETHCIEIGVAAYQTWNED